MSTPTREELMKEWAQAQDDAETIAKPIIAREMALRKQLFATLFPTPREGVNKVPLSHGWRMKGEYKLEYKLDEAALPEVLKELSRMNVVTAGLVKYRPELVLKSYRELKPEAQKILSNALTIKPASPSLELIEPKTEEE